MNGKHHDWIWCHLDISAYQHLILPSDVRRKTRLSMSIFALYQYIMRVHAEAGSSCFSLMNVEVFFALIAANQGINSCPSPDFDVLPFICKCVCVMKATSSVCLFSPAFLLAPVCPLFIRSLTCPHVRERPYR